MSVSDLPPRWTLCPFHSIRGLLERARSARQMDGHVILLFILFFLLLPFPLVLLFLHFLCLLLPLLLPFLLLFLPFHLSSSHLLFFLPPSPPLHFLLPFLLLLLLLLFFLFLPFHLPLFLLFPLFLLLSFQLPLLLLLFLVFLLLLLLVCLLLLLLFGLGQVQDPTQGRGLGRQEGANISSDICQRPVVTTHSWRSGEVAGSQWRRLQTRRKVRSRQGRTDGRRRGQRDERETAVTPPERTTSQLAFTPR